MTIPHTSQNTSQVRHGFARRFVSFAGLAAVMFGVALLASRSDKPLAAADPTSGKAKETLVGGQPLFAGWPANQKPDAVIVFSGQTYGYVQPCGCSRPQIGGLERRGVLIESLKAKGWPVAGVDLGDLTQDKPGGKKVSLPEQGKLKYVATMNSLREMGYLAVGIGRTELQGDMFSLLASYALQNEQRPFTLAGNIVGVLQGGKTEPRETTFPGKTRPMVDQIEIGKVGDVSVGVAGVAAKSFKDNNQKNKWATDFDFTDTQKAVEDALTALNKHQAKPELRVLIFQGTGDEAAAVAKDISKLQVIICQGEDLAPLQPRQVKDKNGETTLIIQVGHRGQNVGLLGAFKKPGGGFSLYYQLVPLTEEFLTPGTEAEAIKKNKTLQALEDYAKAVKDAKLLSQYPRVSHSAEIRAANLKPPVNLTYVGTDACKACHEGEYKKWKEHPHSHAVETLEKIAKRPSLRQFDGECMQCHTVGFHYKTGAYDPNNKDEKNKLLHNVGCESCHGPGSGHVAQPNRKDLLELMAEWRGKETAKKLPNAQFMQKIADTPELERGKIVIPPADAFLIRGVDTMCVQCHDPEADPHFDIYKSWPKVNHTGLAPAGGWPVVPPK